MGLLIAFVATPSYAATLASKGHLTVPPDARVLVVSTDPVVQQVLSEDFGVARRSKPSGPPNSLTLTVSLTQRVLRPDVPIMELAPGVPGVADLLKAAGYTPPSPETAAAAQLTGDAAEYMRNGNPSAGQPTYQNDPMVQYQLYRFTGYQPGPPSAPDPRDPRYRPIQPPDYLEPPAGQLYDTAVIAHAVLSDGKSDMTAVAIAHPGDDMHAVKKQLAERIANAVLH
jgi:hypothetical protein